MKILRQDYDFEVQPAPYLINILDECFNGIDSFYDFGCGRGHWAQYLLQKYNIKFECYDIDKEAESFTREKLKNFLIDDKDNNSNFDVVFVSCVTEMISDNDVETAINHIVDKLDYKNKIGRVFLSSSFYNPLSPKWIFYQIISFGNPQKYFLKNKYFRNFHSKNDIIQFFEKRDMSVTRSVRGELIPKGPKYLQKFIRCFLPFHFLYDKFYLILDFKKS